MPCCTYIDQLRHPTDPEIKEWLEKARRIVSPKIYVEQWTIRQKRWLRKPIETHHFWILYNVGGIEYQIINPLGSDSKDAALMYLLGLITGYEKANGVIPGDGK